MNENSVNGSMNQIEQPFQGEVPLALDKKDQSYERMEAQFRAILDNASVGIALTRNSRFELMGQHARQMFSFSEEDYLGSSTRIIFPSDEGYAKFGAQVREAFNDHGYFDGEQILQRKNGQEFWSHMLARGVIAGDPTGGTIWIIEDISGAKAIRDQLAWTATHDGLTKLVNRREFESRLTQAMIQFEGGDLCVMFIDLDRFKAINDSAGHATGDEVLRQVSELLEAQVRSSDTVSRFGGDEFAVLLPGCTLVRAQQLAEQMRSAIEDWRLMRGGQEFSVGASIGLAAVVPVMVDIAAVLHAADSACYDAKKGGRNRVVTYMPQQSAP